MFFQVTIVFMFTCELYFVDGAIVGSSSKQHVNNILKNEHIKHPVIHGTPKFAHVEITTIQPDHSHIATNDLTKKIRPPIKITLPQLHKKDSTEIKDPLAHDMQIKVPNKDVQSTTHLENKPLQNILKQEVPKRQKKLYHHITLEDIRQRRKELREKWQARHNRLALDIPRGLHNKNEEEMKVSPKHLTIPHNLNKLEAEKSTPKEFIKKRMHLDIPHPNIYEQITPRTRRILEHKEDTHKEPLYSSKYKQLFSARSNAGTPSTFMVIKKTTEYIPPEIKSEIPAAVSEKQSASTDPSSSDQSTKDPTESNFNPNCTAYSDTMKTTASSTSSSSLMEEVSTKNNPYTPNPHETEAKLLDEDTKSEDEYNHSINSRQGDVRPFGYGPSLDEIKNPIPLFNINPLDFTTSSPKVDSIQSLDENTKESDSSINSRQGDVRPFGYGPFLDEIKNPIPLFNINPLALTTTSPKVGSIQSLDENTKESDSSINSRQGDVRPFGYGPFLDEIKNPIPLFNINPLALTTSSPKVGSMQSLDENTKDSNPSINSRGSFVYGPSLDEIVNPVAFYDISPDSKSTSSPKVGSMISFDENAKESNSPVKSRGSFGYGPSLDEIVNPVALYDISPISTSTSSPKVGSIKTVHEDVQSEEVFSPATISGRKESSITTSTSSPKVGSIKTVHEDIQSDEVLSSATTSGPKERSVARKTTTVTTESSRDDVVSVKIDPYDFTVEVYTEKIDTPPFYRNLTFHEKLLHDKPVFIYGKSAEQVGVTEISKKKEIDSAEINVHSQKHGKRSSVHTTKTLEGSSMKISEDSHVHQDWRENLRKAIKERLRKLTRDSGEKRLL